jgi:predicted aspartyl protease
MPVRVRSRASAASRRSPKRARTSRASWTRIVACALLSALLVAGQGTRGDARQPPLPDLRDLLSRYARAVDDAGSPEIERFESTGTLTGGGLAGTFHTWIDGDRERTDQNLGPRDEKTLRIGERLWFADSDGDVREFTGILARRARTQRFIDSGDFAQAPDRCALRGRQTIGGRQTFAVDVTAQDGETETLYLDAQTSLPVRIAYDDDDGRTTIDLSDWRSVGGHRFPFKTVASDGDHAFDTTETTATVDLTPTIDPAVFAPFVARRIELTAPDTVAVQYHDGHLFAPVRIANHDYTFLLDTGAQNILIDKRVAADLGLNAVGSLEASGATRTGGLQLAKVDELDIGRARLRDVVATTIDLGASTDGAFRIDGILGYPFFAASTVRLDPDARTMTLAVPGSLTPQGEKIPLQVDRAFPEAELRVNSTTQAEFIIDTGNAGELLLYKPFVDKHPGIVPFTTNSRKSFGIGGETASYRSALERLDLGTIPIYHADTDVMLATSGAFADRFDAGNVGLGLLRNFQITFDLANAAMYVVRGAEFNDGHMRI